MGFFNHYETHHLHEFVYPKKHIDDELNKKPDHSDIQTSEANIRADIPKAVEAETLVRLSETLFWESYQTAECLYKIDRGLTTEITMNNSKRKVSNLYDQSLKENNSQQTDDAKKPVLCNKAEKINYRYFLKFDGTKRMLSDINLNPKSGASDIVNIFIVYKINSFAGNPSYPFRNGLFGHDNGGWDKFICFGINGDLVIGGTTNNNIVVGSNKVNNKTPIADYKAKANAGDINKWCSLSSHWDVPGGNNASEVWCNGKKLTDFTSRSTTGSNQLTFGDLNPNGIIGLQGDIGFFCLYKGEKLSELTIKLHHQVLCRWCSIDHDVISF